MASTKTGEGLSGPISEVIGAEELRNTQSEANEFIPKTKRSMSSVDGDHAISDQTQSLSADKSQNKTEEHEENGASLGNGLEDAPSLENSKCEQDSVDNGRETATDKTSTENPPLGYETCDIRTSATTEHEYQESPTPSGPDQSKSSQQHGLNSTMYAGRLQTQRNLPLRVAGAINQVGAASEAPDTRGPSGPTGGMSNHALQDYQMQLMLLEQQNKMRLLRARQQQDVPVVVETNSDDKLPDTKAHL